MTGQELAQAAWERLQPKGATDFARKLKLGGDHRDKRVKRWLAGEHDPDFDSTIKMLLAAKLLREEAGELSPGDPLVAPIEQNIQARLEALEEAVAQGFEETRTALEDLTAVVVQQAQPQPSEAAQTKKGAG